MKILIATGIYPPEIGGPATYSENLFNEFTRQGHTVSILPFRTVRFLPTGIRHAVYSLKVLFRLRSHDFVLAIGTFSAPVPAMVAAKLLRKKIIVRLGGDFLWESYMARTKSLISLREFYMKMPTLSFKERCIFLILRASALYMDAFVFSTAWQKDIFVRSYQVSEDRVYVIENFYPKKAEGVDRTRIETSHEKVYLWAGRPVWLKNLDVLKAAFEKAAAIHSDLELKLVSDIPRKELEKIFKRCWALILPSITEVSPNTLIEALAFNVPFILSRETGIYDRVKDIGLFVDPKDQTDIVNKILFLSDEKHHEEYRKRVEDFRFEHSWGDIAKEFLDIYKRL